MSSVGHMGRAGGTGGVCDSFDCKHTSLSGVWTEDECQMSLKSDTRTKQKRGNAHRDADVFVLTEISDC